jgi:hypothetical protein
MGTVRSFPGGKADHSPPTRAEVKKMWIYTSTPIRLHGVVLNYLSTGITLLYLQNMKQIWDRSEHEQQWAPVTSRHGFWKHRPNGTSTVEWSLTKQLNILYMAAHSSPTLLLNYVTVRVLGISRQHFGWRMQQYSDFPPQFPTVYGCILCIHHWKPHPAVYVNGSNRSRKEHELRCLRTGCWAKHLDLWGR